RLAAGIKKAPDLPALWEMHLEMLFMNVDLVVYELSPRPLLCSTVVPREWVDFNGRTWVVHRGFPAVTAKVRDCTSKGLER
uniref:hypothetical protein n=1 Tax=Streptococcus suis TaxID=1307 RepID=UPI00370D166D